MSEKGSGRRSVTSALGIATLVVFLAATRIAAAAMSSCESHAARTHQTLPADRLDNWEPLDERTVLIWSSHSNRAHLLRLETPLFGLTEVDVIHLVDGDHDKRVSPCGRDGVAIDDDAGVWQIARIISIEPLSSKRTAELDSGARAAASIDLLRA